MPNLTILRAGNPLLYQKAVEIEDPTSEEVQKLVADMRSTLESISINGMAAPQVGVSRRLLLYRITPDRILPGSAMRPIDWRPLINPHWTPLTERLIDVWERCLSFPGLHGKVPRYHRIGVEAWLPDGSRVEFEAAGYHATLLQHEHDHLDGMLYPMRMRDLSTLSFDSELGQGGFAALRPLDPTIA